MRANRNTLNALLMATLAIPLALPLAAQETPAPDEATSPPAAVEAAPEARASEAPAAAEPDATGAAATEGTAPSEAAEAPPAGQEAIAEPQVGEPYIREAYGSWGQRCLKAEEGPDPCQLYQLLEDEQGNAVAEISMFPLPEGGEAVAGATIVTPLETLLTANLTLTVDGTAARSYPFTFCNTAGCVARVGFTADEIAQFKRGNEAAIRLVPAAAPDQEVVLTFSLSGFTAGYDAQQTSPAQ